VHGLGSAAERELRAAPAYLAELDRWTRDDPAATDGIPPVGATATPTFVALVPET
jgi:hypothetical protein